MRKHIKAERKEIKEKVKNKKGEKVDNDIYLNVIGVPVTNVSVDKTLERQPTSDFHMYRISIDTSSRSSRETTNKKTSGNRLLTSPRAASTPPIPTIPSDSTTTSSDSGPRSISTTMIQKPEPLGGTVNASNNPRDKNFGPRKVKGKLPAKKSKDDPDVCYTEEKRPVRIVGRLKTPEDDKERHRKSWSKRKNSKQVEFSDRDAVFGTSPEQSRTATDPNYMIYKKASPHVYRAQNNINPLYFGSATENDDSANTNKQAFSKPSNASNMKAVKSSTSGKESMQNKSIRPEPKANNETKGYGSPYKTDPHSLSRTINDTQSVKRAAPEIVPASHSNESADLSKDKPNHPYVKPATSSGAEDSQNPAPQLIQENDTNHATNDKLTGAPRFPEKDVAGYSQLKSTVPYKSVKQLGVRFDEENPSKGYGTELFEAPKEKREIKYIDATTSNKNSPPGVISPIHSDRTSLLSKDMTNQLNARNETLPITRDKLTSFSQLPEEDRTGDLQLNIDTPIRNHQVEFSEIPSKKNETKYLSKGMRTMSVIEQEPPVLVDNKQFNLQKQLSFNENSTDTRDLGKYESYLMPSTSKSPSRPTFLFQDPTKGLQTKSGVPSYIRNNQPTTERSVITDETNGPGNKDIKRIVPISTSKQPSKETISSKREVIDISPSRLKYTTTPLVTSIPKPTFKSTKSTYTMDNPNGSKVFDPLEKPNIRGKSVGVNEFTSTDTGMNVGARSTKQYPISIDHEDFGNSVQSRPVYYLEQEPTIDESRSFELSHRTYGDLFSVDTKTDPLDNASDRKAVHESFYVSQANSNYRGINPRDTKDSQAKSDDRLPSKIYGNQTNQNLDELNKPVLKGSYIPTRPVRRSTINVGSSSHAINSIVMDTPGTSGTQGQNVYPTFSASPSRRHLDQEEIKQSPENLKETNIPGTEEMKKSYMISNKRPVDYLPVKRSVDENLFENRINTNYVARGYNNDTPNNNSYPNQTRQSFVGKQREEVPFSESVKYNPTVDNTGGKEPSSHWSKDGTKDVYAYVGHIDPNNPFGHKGNEDDYVEDRPPDFDSKYIDDDTLVPYEKVEVPVFEERLKESIVSPQNSGIVQEANKLSYMPSDGNNYKPKTRESKGFPREKEAPIGRNGRTSKRNIPAIDTIPEEEPEPGTENTFNKQETIQQALGESNKSRYHKTTLNKNGLRDEPSRWSKNAPLKTDDKDAISMDGERNNPRDLFAYLEDVDNNTGPFGNKGEQEGPIDTDFGGNKPEEFSHDNTSMPSSVGSRQGKLSERTEDKKLENQRPPPIKRPVGNKPNKPKLVDHNNKPPKESITSAKPTRKSQGGRNSKSKKGSGTKLSEESGPVSSSKPDAVFLGRIPNSSINVIYSPDNDSQILPVKEDGHMIDGRKTVTEGPKGILIFVNKKNDSEKSPFEDPDVVSKRSSKWASEDKTNRPRDISPDEDDDISSNRGKHPYDGKLDVEKEGSTTIVNKEYPCGCMRTTTLDRNNELLAEDLISINCRDGSRCTVKHPTLLKHDRFLSMDESAKSSAHSGRRPLSSRSSSRHRPSSEFPEVEVIADGVVSKKPIEPKPPKPTMRGANLTGTINIKSNKFNGVCHLYLEPRLKDYLRNNMHILQELLERDEKRHSRR